MDLQIFGGPDVGSQPQAGSLFCELDTIGLVAARSGRGTLAPTAFLARLEAPLPHGPVALSDRAALAPLNDTGGGVRRIEWWDRDAGKAVLNCAAEVSDRGLRQSARVIPGGDAAARLSALAGAGIDRVIFEVDRIESGEPMPQSAACSGDLGPWVSEARRCGLEVGILLVVGIPGETIEGGKRRTEAVRALRPDRIRCVPFEPTGGHPVYGAMVARGWWPPRDLRWIREVHRPLRQPGLGREEFVQNWSEALMLQAEVACRRKGG
jgi:hypothetical protein